jgi:hypothetical protein
MGPNLAVIQPTAAFHLQRGPSLKYAASQSQRFQPLKKILQHLSI